MGVLFCFLESGKTLNPENYRPIANLNHPVKNYEKLQLTAMHSLLVTL